MLPAAVLLWSSFSLPAFALPLTLAARPRRGRVAKPLVPAGPSWAGFNVSQLAVLIQFSYLPPHFIGTAD